MELATLMNKSREVEILEVETSKSKLDQAAGELFPGGAWEPSTTNEDRGHGWRLLTVEAVSADEDVQVYESSDAMRFGPRRYTDEQFDHIRRATAERSGPSAAPIPLDD
jgi:hypothetical protein